MSKMASSIAGAVDAGLSSQDSDDELPIEWEVRTTDTGRVYYANHSTKTTQWQHPKTGRLSKLCGELPSGWLKQTDSEGNVIFLNTITQQTTLTDPRLLAVSSAKAQAGHKFGASSTAEDVLKGQDLTGTVAIVTGASSGIGYAAASALALHGAHVIMTCRNVDKAHKMASLISEKEQSGKGCEVDVMQLDLASFTNIRKFAKDFRQRNIPLHVLICNAGVLGGPWQMTEDNIEHTFAVNYLGHFLLIHLLQDVLCSSAPARIVMLSSESHRFLDLNYSSKLHLSRVPLPRSQYWSILAYNQSKMCCLMFCIELTRRLASHGVTCNAVHPGNLIYTSLFGKSYLYWLLFSMARVFTKTPDQGAATVVYCATSQDLEGLGGQYYINCRPVEPSAEATDPDKAMALWSLSERLISDAGTRDQIAIIDI